MESLPDLVKFIIVSMLPIKDLLAVSLSNRSWYRSICRSESIYLLIPRRTEMTYYLQDQMATLDPSSLRLLLSLGVNLQEAVYSEIRVNRSDLISLLLRYPFSKEDPQLIESAISKPHVLFQLFSAGVNPNLHFSWMMRTPLIQAVINQDLTLVQQLLQIPSIDVNAIDRHSCSALHYACGLRDQSNSPNLILAELLIQNGANVNSQNISLQTPLMMAVNYHAPSSMIKYLLEHGADPNLASYYEYTPLWDACHNGDYETVLLLLQSGSQVNAKNLMHQTPLFANIFGNYQPEIVDALLSAGANVNHSDRNGNIPLFFAVISRRSTAVEQLITAGGDINQCYNLLSEAHLIPNKEMMGLLHRYSHP